MLGASRLDPGLNGHVAVITGPAKGMGAAVSLAFAAEGCHLVLLGRDVLAIELVAAAARSNAAEVLVRGCDITDEAACEEAIGAAVDAFGRIDILVNVAGGSGPIGKSGAETTPDEFDDIVELNMTGCFIPSSCAAGHDRARYGNIVNVGGTFGMRGRSGRVAYSARKWGLRGITKSFALEVGQYNINVNCVAPGMVDGPRFRDKVCADMAQRSAYQTKRQRHAAEYALKRVTTDTTSRTPACFSPRRFPPDHRRRSAGRRRLGGVVAA